MDSWICGFLVHHSKKFFICGKLDWSVRLFRGKSLIHSRWFHVPSFKPWPTSDSTDTEISARLNECIHHKLSFNRKIKRRTQTQVQEIDSFSCWFAFSLSIDPWINWSWINLLNACHIWMLLQFVSKVSNFLLQKWKTTQKVFEVAAGQDSRCQVDFEAGPMVHTFVADGSWLNHLFGFSLQNRFHWFQINFLHSKKLDQQHSAGCIKTTEQKACFENQQCLDTCLFQWMTVSHSMKKWGGMRHQRGKERWGQEMNEWMMNDWLMIDWREETRQRSVYQPVSGIQ